jgi:hypothetical protein
VLKTPKDHGVIPPRRIAWVRDYLGIPDDEEKIWSAVRG